MGAECLQYHHADSVHGERSGRSVPALGLRAEPGAGSVSSTKPLLSFGSRMSTVHTAALTGSLGEERLICAAQP